MAETVLQEEEFSGGFSFRPWKRIFREGRSAWKWIALMAAIAPLTALGDAGFTLVTKFVIDDATSGAGHARTWVYAWLLAGLALGFSACVGAFILIAGKISTGLSHQLRTSAFARLQDLSFSYYDRRSVGWLVTRLTSDSDRLARLIAWGTLDAIWSICMLAGISGVLLFLNWRLALMVLSVLPPLLVLSYWFQKRLLLGQRKIRKTNSRITASFNEGIMGVRTTKTLVRERQNLGEFQELSGLMYGDSVRNAILHSLYFPLMLGLTSLAAGVAMWRGGLEVLEPQAAGMSLGTLFAFVSFSLQFFFPVQELSRFLADSQAAQAAAERVAELLDTVPEIRDSPQVRAAIDRARANPDPALAIDGGKQDIQSVEFRDVSFAYKSGHNVLENFNLKVRSGETIALVGPTGGGKSTIVSLLCRFYEPTAGQILLDGVEYRHRSLLWLQSNLGIVLQTPYLFGGSIRENIRYGRLDATDAEVEQAARWVDAHDFIQATQKGYDTPVGEGGMRLSTGQKQLISFARAVLADPQIFVMDEATSSVDTTTEQRIQSALGRILAGRISFVIAHRLSTIRSADRILLIDSGCVVEQGTHHELIERRGAYFRLYTHQFTREHEEHLMIDS
jgi:ATP-binding cassette subfamily B protein